MKNTHDHSYWEERYIQHNTPWDIGYANPGLLRLVEQHFTKESKILIPGAGIGHEAGQLWKMGYHNVHVCDWSEAARDELIKHNPDFPEEQIIIGDFFEIYEAFDGIIEQTFFCALPPTMRASYVKKTFEILNDNGRLVGVLFNREFPFEGPPFGGSIMEYRGLFEHLFRVDQLEQWAESIPPRMGTECIIVASKVMGS